MTYRHLFALAGVLVLASRVTGQTRPDLFQCEGCEAINDRSHDSLTWQTTIAGLGEPGERLVLSGRVFKPDGRTPAPNVIVYAYQTNAAGIYPPANDAPSAYGRRHGMLRGWTRTNAHGEYRFNTIRPGTYPSRIDPAHIHMILKEPNRQEYWIDDVVFTDDPLVDARYRQRLQTRGGNGVVTPMRDANGTWQARRDITLER